MTFIMPGTLVECPRVIMHVIRRCTRCTFMAYAAALPVLLASSASAQESVATTAARATPSACVRVAGPNVERAPRVPPGSSTRTGRTTGDTLPIAIRLIASVSADEVRFEKSPVVCVKLSGDARLDSVHVLARRNLATPVVRNTTYRDVYVAVEILGRLNADCISAAITGTRVAGADSTARCASIEARSGGGGGPR